MTMREKLEEDITQAMRDRDKVRLEALRFLKAKQIGRAPCRERV